MDILKGIGKLAGDVTGKVLGGTVRVAGELVHSDYIKEIGNDVERVTAKTGEIAGQAASGVWDVGAGLVTSDKHQAKSGLNELGDVVTTTVKSAGQGIEYVVNSGADLVTGIKERDTELMKDSAKKLGRAAAVTILAVGVVDLVDGPDGADPSGTV
ncbi:hypothetical protein [Paenibacillus sacheonensis]|uniref:Uncharacterized protein n=1 Tax=Paenibacillus sacheonensis TaxID=742054 RepID=A0A7X4YL41_9BACL|nr:hypothetical protein [Paenibacillus sacheonensis]MBM7563094.1 hypothetical protein [Paenibacillus sacheonensis]NBC68338.1 hypothetical protein [Paenibacillus sacheonensis]